MKAWIRKVALGLALGAGALGCSSKEPATAVTAQAVIPDREVIAYIPQDTPYLYMGLEALPKALVEKGSVLGKAFSESVQKGFWDELGRNGVVAPKPAQFLDELNGVREPKDLARFGLSPDFRVTIYGLGLWPVLRVELQDVEKAKAFVQRIEAKGEPWPEKKLGDQAYFAFEKDKTSVVYAFVKNEFVMAVVPTPMAEQLLKIAFLQEKPQNAFTDMRALKALSQDFGLRYGMGYIDNRILGDLLLGRTTQAALWKAQGFEMWSELPEGCSDEIAQILTKMPRFVFGMGSKTSGNAYEMKFGLELDPSIAKELSAIAGQGIGDTSGGKLLMVSLALDVQKTMDYLKKQLTALNAAPYRCEWLSTLPALGIMVLSGAPMLLPSQMMDLSAVTLVLDEVQEKTGDSGQRIYPASGRIGIAHAHPENLLPLLKDQGMSVDLKPDGKTVDIAAGKLTDLFPNRKVQARMTPNALGVSFTEGTATMPELPKFMDARGEPGVIVMLGFDFKLLEWVRKYLNAQSASRTLTDKEVYAKVLEDIKETEGLEKFEEFCRIGLSEERCEAFKKANWPVEEMAGEIWKAAQEEEKAHSGEEVTPLLHLLAEQYGMMKMQIRLTPKGVMGEMLLETK